MNAGPSGFRGAPLTKTLLIAAVSSSIIIQAASQTARRRIPLLVSGFSHFFVFRSPAELLFGVALTYYFRLFERQIGSGKYGAFLLITSSMAYVFQTVLASMLHRPSASGLYPLIFANIVPFMLEIPALHKFSMLGLRMTDKAFIYVAVVQLLLSSGQRSVAAGFCGMLAGALYHFNLLGIRRFRLPRALEDLISSTVGRILPGSNQLQQIYAQPPTQPPGPPPFGRDAGAGGDFPTAPNLPEPSPEALQQLMLMGFDEEQAARALQTSNNNVERAVQTLIS